MKIFTVHLRPDTPPVLVREGFSPGALLFGPLWLLARGAWVPAALLLAADVVAALLPGSGLAVLALAILTGFSGNDLRRWGLSLRGFDLAQVVVGRSADAAYARLLEVRTDLIPQAAAPL